jgi:hypothetical protein
VGIEWVRHHRFCVIFNRNSEIHYRDIFLTSVTKAHWFKIINSIWSSDMKIYTFIELVFLHKIMFLSWISFQWYEWELASMSAYFYMPVVRRDVLCYGVVRPSVCASVRGHHWNLGYCFVVKSYSSSSRFGVIDSFLQKLCPWNLEEFKKFSVLRTFFCHLCSYMIETWVIVL